MAGKFISVRQTDETLSKGECFWWLSGWRSCPTRTIAGMFELYKQLLTGTAQKTRTTSSSDVMSRLCTKAPESIAHILCRRSALVQNQYLSRHNRALKILFFEIIHGLDLIDRVLPWCSPIQPKPVYESDDAQAFRDIPVFA